MLSWFNGQPVDQDVHYLFYRVCHHKDSLWMVVSSYRLLPIAHLSVDLESKGEQLLSGFYDTLTILKPLEIGYAGRHLLNL